MIMGRAGALRRSLRPVSLVALLVALAVTGGIAWTVHSAVRSQEHRLLKERTAELALVFNSAVDAISPAMMEQGTVLRVSHGARAAYDDAAAAAVKASNGQTSFAWLKPTSDGSGFVVAAAAGTSLHDGEVIADARAQTMRAALGTPQLVATPVIGSQRVLGFALGPPAAPAGTVIYREQPLGPVAAPRQAGTAPFSELDVVLYAVPRVQPEQVLVSTTKTLPLRGYVRDTVIPAGATKWLMSVKARQPLVGGLTAHADWLALGAGILGSLLAAAVVEISARRRNAALALYEAEHQIAETLQRSLLPTLPSLPGLDLAARYLASGTGQQVGGDWFDVFPISGGRVGLVVGDVIGHDLTAASEMSQIRSALRAYAVDGDAPSLVITRLDRLVDALRLTQLVTIFYAVLEPPDPDGRRVFRYSNAGHLPPVLRRADGTVEQLGGGGSAVLGAPIAIEHTEEVNAVDPGDLLVMFTDGLVEVPGGSLDDGLARLGETIGQQSKGDAEAVCEQVLAGVSRESLRDDIALLAVRITEPADVPAGRGAVSA
jgi:serine phosphatase RsbU (regulator of sigma subunit)